MKIKDFFIATGKNLLHVFKRYPVTVIFITMLTIVMAFHEDLLDTLDFGGVWFLSIGAMLSLALETGKAIFKTSKVAWIVRVVVYLIHTIISSVIYFYGNNPTDEHVIALASIGCCIVLAVFCLPFVQRREDDIPFYHYTFNLLKAIVISAVFDREILQKTYDIGVSGYISKSSSNSVIMSAIKLVMAGGMYVPPELLRNEVKDSGSDFDVLVKKLEISEKGDVNVNNKESDNSHVLTPRQTEVLQCLAEGLSNKQIAYKLGLSEGTVKIHITLLMRALGVTNRVAAVREAVKSGILNMDG